MLTYNVHSCVGLDGKLSPRRIARVIAQYEPDVVALQEVDVGRARTGGEDQAAVIADDLGMHFQFYPAMVVEGGQYGNCVLSRLPMHLVQAEVLPPLSATSTAEPRVAIWIRLETSSTPVQFVNTHLGLRAGERLAHVQTLLGPQWLGDDRCTQGSILCGDFNDGPSSRVWRYCASRLRDVQTEAASRGARRTWFGHYPLVRIDHIFIGDGIEAVQVDVGDDHLSRIASDHRPLFAELTIPL
jgi:endonuclease/exonuclease/phosphatase family metal-dependent hydrolase